MADASMTPVRDTNGKIIGWSVRWREKDGRRPRRILADKALAERLVAEKRSPRQAATPPTRHSPSSTVSRSRRCRSGRTCFLAVERRM